MDRRCCFVDSVFIGSARDAIIVENAKSIGLVACQRLFIAVCLHCPPKKYASILLDPG
jgi:hypothetical protein